MPSKMKIASQKQVDELVRTIPDFKELLGTTSVNSIADKLEIRRSDLVRYIESVPEFNEIWKSEERVSFFRKSAKERYYDGSGKTRYRELNKDNIKIFDFELNRKGVIKLIYSIVGKAVKEKDEMFFNSEMFEFYQSFEIGLKSKNYYLDLMNNLDITIVNRLS